MQLLKVKKYGKKDAVCIKINFTEPQNLWFIIESDFKSRTGYGGARTVYKMKPVILLVGHQMALTLVISNLWYVCSLEANNLYTIQILN